MFFNIAGKSDINNILNSENMEINSYELHLKTITDFDEDKVIKILSKYKIVSVHQPNYVTVNSKLMPFNLLSDTEVGKLSGESLESTLNKCNKLGIKKVVLHGARYNKQLYSEKTAIMKFIGILEKMRLLKLITIENDALWYNTDTFASYPLIINTGVIKTIVVVLDINITLDIEHMILTNLYFNFIKDNGKIMPLFEFETKFREWIISDTGHKIEKIYLAISAYTNSFAKKINHIHISGSDWFNYYYHGSLPLVGEHLPIGYNLNDIKDRIDYSRIFNIKNNLIKQNKIDMVMEIGLRKNQYNHLEELTRSKAYLENYNA